MAKNTGKNFENEIRKSLHKADDIWWFRIQDTNDVSKYVKQAIAEKQPADFMAVYRSRPVLIECKTTRNLTSFPLYYGSSRSIPKHQVTMASMAQKHGALAFIFIRRDEPRNKRAFAITPDQMKLLYDNATRKSVKWEVIEKLGIELKRLSKPVRYDLSILLNTDKVGIEND